MPSGEFDLIERFFHRSMPARDDVAVGIGDDGAVVCVPDGRWVVLTMATLGTIDWETCGGDPGQLGRTLMLAALDGLAPSGAEPAWATLALTLSESDPAWLETFSDALFAVAAPRRVALVGGDTTRGPFTATLALHGLLEPSEHGPPA